MLQSIVLFFVTSNNIYSYVATTPVPTCIRIVCNKTTMQTEIRTAFCSSCNRRTTISVVYFACNTYTYNDRLSRSLVYPIRTELLSYCVVFVVRIEESQLALSFHERRFAFSQHFSKLVEWF